MNEKLLTRRSLLPLVGAGLLAGFGGFEFRGRGSAKTGRKSQVTLAAASSYEDGISSAILNGLRENNLEVKDKKVLLAVYLEQYDSTHAANADAAVLAGTVAALKTLGAAEIRIGAGPSFERDAWSLAESAGYAVVPNFDSLFLDLNRDEVSPVEGLQGETSYFPNAALRADLVVSLGKMKTDSTWGAALSMTNLLGLVPGSVYGWPKADFQNPGAVITLARLFRRSFAIVDGIVGMEGAGPLFGTPKPTGVLAMGADLGAVDATCCRVMGIDPDRVGYLAESSGAFGTIDARGIDIRGASLESVRTNFALPESMRALRLG
jgi:uncharacterized protein (DUF362 family)